MMSGDDIIVAEVEQLMPGEKKSSSQRLRSGTGSGLGSNVRLTVNKNTIYGRLFQQPTESSRLWPSTRKGSGPANQATLGCC